MTDNEKYYYERLSNSANVNGDGDMDPFKDPSSPYGLASPSSPERGSDLGTKDSSDMPKILAYITDKFKAGSMKGSIFTLITATIGTGILLVPNSISKSGIAWGLMQLLFCGWLGFYSLMLLIRCSEKAKVFSYQELADVTYGKYFRTFVNIVFFFTNWGTAIAYIVLVSQLFARVLTVFFNEGTLPDWMTDTHSKIWPFIIATVFVVPLSLAKELKSLRYFCLLSFCFIMFLGFVVVLESFRFVDFSDNAKLLEAFELKGTSTTFPTAVFAYLSHPNVLDVFKELHNSTKRRMRKVIFRTTILVFTCYAIVGSFGYITFANNPLVLSGKHYAGGVILFAYAYDINGNPQPYPTLVVISLICIGISVIVATPLCIKPAKDGLSDLLFPKADSTEEDSKIKHILLVLITIYSGVGVGILSSSMQGIINILGSSFFTMIAFIMPPLFYIKLAKRSKLWGHKIICWIMLVCFIVFTIWSTYESVDDAIVNGL